METSQPAKRPVFLTVLCILTFVTSGFSLIGLITSAVSGPASPDELEQSMAVAMQSVNQLRDMGADNAADLFEKVFHWTEYMNQSFYLMLLVNCITFALGLGGALLMWSGRKIGFHSYILYNILGTASIYFAVPASEVPTVIIILQVVFSLIFIFMYSRNLHWMK